MLRDQIDYQEFLPLRTNAAEGWWLVGSGTGAVAPTYRRSAVSSSRHITRSGRISRTTRSCTLHDKGYGAYRVGAAAQERG
jgi:hypothetical protein